MIKIVEAFKTNIMEDGKSTNTIQSYVGDVSAFLKYLGTMNVEFDVVLKRFYITNYKNYLIDNSYEPATINKKVNSIQAFNDFLITKGYMQENVIDLKKDRVKIAVGSEHQVEVYSDNQIERLQCLYSKPKESKHKR